jgi:hypothetical protein
MDGNPQGDGHEWAAPALDHLLQPQAPSAPRPRGRLRLWLTLGGVAGLLAGAIALVGTEPDRDPDEALASAQAMVDDATSFRFTISLDADGFDVGAYRDAVAANLPPDEVDEELSQVGDGTFSAQAAGEFASPDWHTTGASRFGDEAWHFEAVLADGVLYRRSGGDADDLADSEFWADHYYAEDRPDREEVLEDLAEVRADLPFSTEEFPEIAAQIDAFFAAELYLRGFGEQLGSDLEQDPRGYLDAVAGLADPSVAHTDGDRLTLRVRMQPSDDVAAVFGGEFPPAEIELDLDGDDQPLALRLFLEAAGMELRIELGFSDWGADIQIDPPPDEELEELQHDDVDELEVEDIDPEAFVDDERPNSYEHFEEVGEAIDSSPGDGPAGSRQSALTGDELRQLELPGELGLVRPAQLGDGLTLEEVVVEQVGDCTTVTIWYEGTSGYLVVWLSQEPCAAGSQPDAVLGGTAVRIDTDDPPRRDAAIESLEPVTVDQLATELDAAG